MFPKLRYLLNLQMTQRTPVHLILKSMKVEKRLQLQLLMKTGLSTSRTMIMTSVDGEKWTSIPQEQLHGRERRENLLRPAPGLTNYALRNIREPNIIMSSWEILFNHDMVETVLKETNRRGKTIKRALWTDATLEEMLAFIGLLYLRGVYRSNMESTEELWSREHGRPIFQKTMTHARFKELRNMLRFDNPETRAARQLRDKLAAIRLLLDGFTSNCQRSYVPGAFLTVDEELYPFRGRCAFKQYMPSKPSRYGL